VIRSVFNADGNEERALAALHFILDELKLNEKARNDRWDRYKQNITAETLETLDKEIFGEQEDGGSVIFYDAFIQPNFSQSIHFLTNDFLTPHRNPLKNPIPLMFLKILPNIAFQFDFNFSNYSPNGVMPSEDLREMFKQIILTLGLGAKTNVGYGQFSLSAMIESADGDSEQLQPENAERIIDKLTVASEDLQQKLISGSEWDAEIVEIDKKKRAIILLSAQGEEVKMKKKADRIKKGEEAKVGLKLRIKFNADYNPNEPNFSIIEIIE
jgi:CRISPR type III-B/RAMP module RAMP protein Cmr6